MRKIGLVGGTGPDEFEATVFADLLCPINGGRQLAEYTSDYYAGSVIIICNDYGKGRAFYYGSAFTEEAYESSANLEVTGLKYIPLVLAGWLRYLMGIDDEGNEFELSPDPMLEKATAFVSGIQLGETDRDKVKQAILPFLTDNKVFGVDLEQVGLSDKIINFYMELVAGMGSVRRTLQKYC